jgi:S1-C subfamily serine protease
MRIQRILSIFCITLTIQGCCAVHTPFDAHRFKTMPMADSYISLKSKGSLIQVTGSAVVIEDGWAVTNRHVIENIKRMEGCMADGHCFAVRNAILSDRFDLAIFRIPWGVGRPMPIGTAARNGDFIYSTGTTCGETFLDGVVVAAAFKLHHVDIVLTDAPSADDKGRSITDGFAYKGDFIRGFSGGPVVNTAGELVGINQGRLIQAISTTVGQNISPEDTFGLAYHIADVLVEVKRLQP